MTKSRIVNMLMTPVVFTFLLYVQRACIAEADWTYRACLKTSGVSFFELIAFGFCLKGIYDLVILWREKRTVVGKKLLVSATVINAALLVVLVAFGGFSSLWFILTKIIMK